MEGTEQVQSLAVLIDAANRLPVGDAREALLSQARKLARDLTKPFTDVTGWQSVKGKVTEGQGAMVTPIAALTIATVGRTAHDCPCGCGYHIPSGGGATYTMVDDVPARYKLPDGYVLVIGQHLDKLYGRTQPDRQNSAHSGVRGRDNIPAVGATGTFSHYGRTTTVSVVDGTNGREIDTGVDGICPCHMGERRFTSPSRAAQMLTHRDQVLRHQEKVDNGDIGADTECPLNKATRGTIAFVWSEPEPEA